MEWQIDYIVYMIALVALNTGKRQWQTQWAAGAIILASSTALIRFYRHLIKAPYTMNGQSSYHLLPPHIIQV
uniref:Uncharacterized protein n=1 Tax=Picea glauca TaxID=3330 RepID=A0A101M2R8_PICGL|nr:hypothetical protein ABT39_MTgene3104 [Picea glauca]QHR86481.1 hypothetical protein Q903MT_gene481 [Picea sitchensis]